MRAIRTGFGEPSQRERAFVKDKADAFEHGLRRGFWFGAAAGAGVVLAVVAALWLGGAL